MFELTSPLNRIVVVHREARLTLLGARDRLTGREIAASEAAPMLGGAVSPVPEYLLTSIATIVDSFELLSPLETEGYVVVDGSFNRIKVKHPGYVILHHAKEGLSRKAFVEIARKGEASEVLTAFPEFRPLLEDARTRLETLVSEIESDYARLRNISEQKAFALEALKTRCSAALFSVRSGKAVGVRAFLASMPIDFLMRMLGYKDDSQAEIGVDR
jgi:hypothetical protein